MKTIRRAEREDLPLLEGFFTDARAYMKASGNPHQWGDDRPTMAAILADLARGTSYIVEEDGEPIGTFAFIPGKDPTYAVIEGKWLSDAPYGTIHRVAAKSGAHGIFRAALSFAEGFGKNLRIDTHEDNATMRHLIEKNGFSYCGVILTDDGTVRRAYEKIVEK